MNRNKTTEILEIASLIHNTKSEKEILKLFSDIFTEPELETLSLRWRILKMLSKGATQREISGALHVSLCKVTRGAKILKDQKSVITKHFKEGKNNEQIQYITYKRRLLRQLRRAVRTGRIKG